MGTGFGMMTRGGADVRAKLVVLLFFLAVVVPLVVSLVLLRRELPAAYLVLGGAFTTVFGGYGLHRQRHHPDEPGSHPSVPRRGVLLMSVLVGLLLVVAGAVSLHP